MDNKEAAFANSRLWQSTGIFISYAYSPYLCVAIKLYIIMSVLLIGTAGYLGIEVLEKKRNRLNITQQQSHY